MKITLAIGLGLLSVFAMGENHPTGIVRITDANAIAIDLRAGCYQLPSPRIYNPFVAQIQTRITFSHEGRNYSATHSSRQGAGHTGWDSCAEASRNASTSDVYPERLLSEFMAVRAGDISVVLDPPRPFCYKKYLTLYLAASDPRTFVQWRVDSTLVPCP